MSDRLDFSSLSEGPVGALAPADQVMARGAQRKRRRTTALAAAALVLVAGGASLAATVDGDSDALQYAPAPTPTASAPTPPEPTASATAASTALTSASFPTAAELGAGWTASAVATGGNRDVVARCSVETVGTASSVGEVTYTGPDGAYAYAKAYVMPMAQALTALERLASDADGCVDQPQDGPGPGSTLTMSVRTSTGTHLVYTAKAKECQDDGTCATTDTTVDVRVLGDALLVASTSDARAVELGAAFSEAYGDPGTRFPAEAQIAHGDKVWGVYLAVSRDEQDSKLAAAEADVERHGYHAGVGQIGCDQGAYQALGLPDDGYSAVAVYFDTQAKAQQFVDAYEPGVVGTARVTIFCAD